MNDENMLKKICILERHDYPDILRRLRRLPRKMNIIGTTPSDTYKYLCVVGSRNYSDYGKEVCKRFITALAGYPIIIVSGLAIGIDSIAHEAALDAGLQTIAFPGSGLNHDVLYPQRHLGLAERIIKSGGTLLSPFKNDQLATNWTFPTRNTLMAGISHATLVIEAAESSGTLLTANDAIELGRDVLVVPGSVFSKLSRGSHKLIRDGAILVRDPEDILEVLGLKNIKDSRQNVIDNIDTSDQPNQTLFSNEMSSDENRILNLLNLPIKRDEIIRKLALPAGYVNAILIEFEIKGMICELDGYLVKR